MVLASGTGSLLASLLHAAVGDYPARVVAVGTDRDCAALGIAAGASVPTYTVRLADHPDRRAWDAALTEATAKHQPDQRAPRGAETDLVFLCVIFLALP